MKLGFSGTRRGMTDWQKRRLREFLRFTRPTEFHHGDCIGADAQAHKIVREVLPECQIVIHPSSMRVTRAGCVGDLFKGIYDPLVRNKNIVDGTDELVAAPETTEEQQRSGTWATVRMARAVAKKVELLERDDPYAAIS